MYGNVFEREVEKRQRLVQTYIVLFGLLLSYAQNKVVMVLFILFLISIMVYYSHLTGFRDSYIRAYGIRVYVFVANAFAFLSTALLSLVIFGYLLDIGSDEIYRQPLSIIRNNGYMSLFFAIIGLIGFLFLCMILSKPLFIHRYMLHEYTYESFL